MPSETGVADRMRALLRVLHSRMEGSQDVTDEAGDLPAPAALYLETDAAGAGDLVRHGVSALVAGDCVEVMRALPEATFDLIFADPPYNLQLRQTLVRPNLTVVDAVDEAWDRFDSFESYDAFTGAWLAECRRLLKPTGTIWTIGTYHNIFRVGKLMQDLGFWILNAIAWIKTNPMPQFRGVRFCNAHETLIWAKRDRRARGYTFNYHALKAENGGKQMRSDWWSNETWVLPICAGRERLRDAEGRKLHATQKPERLLERVILATSNPGDLVLDPFAGTGTTGVVAGRHGRRWVMIEREPEYVALIRERLAAEGNHRG